MVWSVQFLHDGRIYLQLASQTGKTHERIPPAYLFANFTFVSANEKQSVLWDAEEAA